MIQGKFDEYDRREVIAKLENCLQVKLSPIGRRHKYLCDTNGRRYCVLGGCGDWHGIPEEIVREEEIICGDSVLVIAIKYKQTLDIYLGDLKKLIAGKSRLILTKIRQYEFNIKLQDSRLFIKEVPGLSLRKLVETPYSETEKTSQKTFDKFEAVFKNLSPEKQKEVLKRISAKISERENSNNWKSNQAIGIAAQPQDSLTFKD
jgi:hypothetical protein